MSWPKLSETLLFPRSLFVCQSCGSDQQLDRWQEHDDQDKPSHRAVVLCGRCSERIIKPHPRLYARMQPAEALPGAMGICVGCRHLQDLDCDHPDQKRLGGSGLRIISPKIVGFACSRGRGGGCHSIYNPGVPSQCDGRQVAPKEPA